MTAALVFAFALLWNAAAATDPAVLVGTWKGEVEVAGGRWPTNAPRGKILHVDSLKQQGGKWMGETRYETVGEGIEQVNAELEVRDKIKVKFDTSSRTRIVLELSDTPPWELAGTYSRTGGVAVHRLKLRKVE